MNMHSHVHGMSILTIKLYKTLLSSFSVLTKYCTCFSSISNFGHTPKFKRGITPRNKRPMGHIAHLRKQFKSINTYDYIITLIKRRKNNIIYFMRIYCFFIWRILNPPHPRMLCAKIGWNWLSGSGEEDF